MLYERFVEEIYIFYFLSERIILYKEKFKSLVNTRLIDVKIVSLDMLAMTTD